MRESLYPARIGNIFHPSDFSEGSAVAFRHALKAALAANASLSILHVSADTDSDWQDFPRVRDTLERWGLIPKDSPREAVAGLGINVQKVGFVGRDPVKACLGYLEAHPADLIVLAVHQQVGRMGWLGKSVGKPVARRSGEMSLYLPHGVSGFVSEDGNVSLRRIVVPIAAHPRPQPAVEAVRRVIAGLALPAGEVTLLHVGSAHDAPAVNQPVIPGWTWQRVNREGDVIEAIVDTAGAASADLIVMTTDGRDGFLDAIRGSTSERVLSQVKCPLLSLPAGSFLG